MVSTVLFTGPRTHFTFVSITALRISVSSPSPFFKEIETGSAGNDTSIEIRSDALLRLKRT